MIDVELELSSINIQSCFAKCDFKEGNNDIKSTV